MSGSLQDAFLAECKRLASTVTVSLTNGSQLHGVVKGFDPFTLLLEFENQTHLIYKHGVVTISPGPDLRIPGGT